MPAEKIENQPMQDNDNREVWNAPSFKSFDARDAEVGPSNLADGNNTAS
jgi:hypothetical protein